MHRRSWSGGKGDRFGSYLAHAGEDVSLISAAETAAKAEVPERKGA